MSLNRSNLLRSNENQERIAKWHNVKLVTRNAFNMAVNIVLPWKINLDIQAACFYSYSATEKQLSDDLSTVPVNLSVERDIVSGDNYENFHSVNHSDINF